jgi:hypothetical protein
VVGSDWRKILEAFRVSVCRACRGSGLDYDHAIYTYSPTGFIISATFPKCPNGCPGRA